ncbi:MAG: hypothetical protein PSV13_02025 [Lacunisphaera sp.]|nr:hypothetical protein [Lacunisphaera sp.]
MLVVDKSYANAKSGSLAALAGQYTILVPSAFIFEVFTTSKDNLKRELRHFPNFRGVHLPEILRTERRLGQPATQGKFPLLGINPDVLNDSWSLPDRLERVILEYRETALRPEIDFLKVVIAGKWIPGFTVTDYQAIRGSGDEFVALCGRLRDTQRIRAIAKELNFEHAERLTDQWLFFRYFQVNVLQALVLLRRYPNSKDDVSEMRLEHDSHDNEYLMLGLHARALATMDNSSKICKASMAFRFRLLEPNGLLIPNYPEANPEVDT